MHTTVLAVLSYALLTSQALAHSMMTVPRGRGNLEWFGTCGKLQSSAPKQIKGDTKIVDFSPNVLKCHTV